MAICPKEEHLRTLADEMVFGLKTPFWGMKVNVRTIVDEIMSDLKERSFAGIYCAMIERFARASGNKPRWGEKTPHNLFFVKEILEDFPNAQFICITRDGRDASADYLEFVVRPDQHLCRRRKLGAVPERCQAMAQEFELLTMDGPEI